MLIKVLCTSYDGTITNLDKTSIWDLKLFLTICKDCFQSEHDISYNIKSPTHPAVVENQSKNPQFLTDVSYLPVIY